MHKVLFTGSTLSNKELLALQKKNIEIIPAPKNLSEKELILSLKDCEAVIVNGNEIYSENVLKKLPKLKYIQFYGIGYQKCINLEIANKYRKKVLNTPKVNSYSVAEFTLGLIFTLNQKLLQHNEATRLGYWKEANFFDLKGKTIGIIGLGHIGTILADIMYKGFNAKILFYDILDKKREQRKYKAKKVELAYLFKNSDIVTLHLPLTDLTKSLIGVKELSLMKPTAYFINTARAEIVDAQALYNLLKANKIAGCAFDGFYSEPVNLRSAEAKLLTLPTGKFILTPHTGYNALEGNMRIKNMCLDNLVELFTSGSCAKIINKD